MREKILTEILNDRLANSHYVLLRKTLVSKAKRGCQKNILHKKKELFSL